MRRSRLATTTLVPLLLLVAGSACGLVCPGRALADGDPASDVLAQQPVFIPADGAIPAAGQAQVLAIVRAAQRRGDPLRVALIAHRSDLGSIGALWGQPARYSGFLGSELSLVFHGTLLVVMPDGYGVDVIGERDGAARLASAAAALRGLPPPGGGSGLADGAVTAVRRSAATAGVALAAPAATVVARSPRSDAQLLPWLAFGLGAAAIAAAWAASLRARPWRPRQGVASPNHGT